MKSTNDAIADIHKKAIEQKNGIARGDDKVIDKKLDTWYSMHRLRVLALAIGVGLFYLAEEKASKKWMVEWYVYANLL